MLKLKETSKYKLKFFDINDTIILFKKKESLEDIIQNINIEKITKNTVETWQKDRPSEEKTRNTNQGKIAENFFSDFINSISDDISYLSYDEFRGDRFKKHAPIDGLLFQKGNLFLQEGIDKIKNDVQKSQNGSMQYSTFEWLSEQKLFTVEVKSSRIPDKDYRVIANMDLKKLLTLQKLIEKLSERDFFLYPKYTRDHGNTIKNFEEYIKFVVDNKKQTFKSEDYEREILEQEVKGRCDVYTRIFIDQERTDSYIAFLMGYAHKEYFFKEPNIIRMPRGGKSEKALYYAYPINKSMRIMNLVSDKKFWGFD